MTTQYTTSSSFEFKLLNSLNEYGYVQDRLSGDDLSLPNSYQQIKIKPNDHTTADVINHSLNLLHENWLYLISSSVIPSNSIPNQDYATHMIVDTARSESSTTPEYITVGGNDDVNQPLPKPKWIETFDTTAQFKEAAAQGGQWRDHIWQNVKDITKIRNVANPDHYNLVANTTTNIILLSGHDVNSIDVVGNFNDENNPIYSDSDVTHPSNEVLFRDIKNHVVTQQNELFVLDGFHKTLFKFDINGILSLDTAILLNDTPGRLMTGMIGGPGDVTDKTRFNTPIVVGTQSNLLYVVDYSAGHSVIKMFDSDLNWKTSYDVGDTLDAGPIDIKYNSQTQRFYILTHRRTYFGSNNITSDQSIEPAKLVIFDSTFNHIETRDLNDTRYSANINVESYKRIYFSLENMNIMYVVTNKGVYKKYVSRPERFIGEFLLDDKNVGGGDRSQNFTDITMFETSVSVGSDVIQKDEILLVDNFYEVVFRFLEDSNYERSLQTEFDDKVLYFDDLKVYPDEYVSTLTYNKVFTKHIYNNALLMENTYRKFTTKYNVSGIPQYLGFRYLNESQLNQTNYNVPMDHYVGTNELVTTGIFNRCLNQILEIQNNVLDKMKERAINVFPLITSPVLLTSPYEDQAATLGIDTDFDGIPDAADFDDDNDGLSDILEAAVGTDPTEIDTDSDGLTDSEEYFGNPATDPTLKDSDSDTVDDGFDSFPTDPAASSDFDQDNRPDDIKPNRVRVTIGGFEYKYKCVKYHTSSDQNMPGSTGNEFWVTDDLGSDATALPLEEWESGTVYGGMDRTRTGLIVDEDDDNDGVPDDQESNEYIKDPNRVDGVDSDGDGVDDILDLDDDDDTFLDHDYTDTPSVDDKLSSYGDEYRDDEGNLKVEADQSDGDIHFDNNPDRATGIDTDSDLIDDIVDTDDDGDGFFDTQETQGITQLMPGDEEPTTFITDPLVADTDGDGLTDFEEVGPGGTGTSPLDKDTDEDSVEDLEDHFPLDPAASVDTDDDGQPDSLIPGVDSNSSPPLQADLDDDDDGLTDQREAEIGTDPLNPDSDGDGLIDGQEVDVHGTDPNKSDSDDDGLTDFEEVEGYTSTDGQVFTTDPNKSDSDDDGLTDFEEVEGYTSTDGQVYTTNPNNPDSDDDGLTDIEEMDGKESPLSGETYTSNPNMLDTDNDGLTDAQELGISHKQFDINHMNNIKSTGWISVPSATAGNNGIVSTSIKISINGIYIRPSVAGNIDNTNVTGTVNDPYLVANSSRALFAQGLRDLINNNTELFEVTAEFFDTNDQDFKLILTAVQTGSVGNNISLTKTTTNQISISGPNLSGGSDDVTDPNLADTDADLLTDAQELREFDTDPNDPDSDDDQLTDSQEVQTYDTDPNDPDSDDDQLTDYQEVQTYNTDPNDPDSDDDNIRDNIEVGAGTNPNDPDTDDDTIQDDIDLTPATYQLQFVDPLPDNYVITTDKTSVTYTHPTDIAENTNTVTTIRTAGEEIKSLFVNSDQITNITHNNSNDFQLNNNENPTHVILKADRDFESGTQVQTTVTVKAVDVDGDEVSRDIVYKVNLTDQTLQVKTAAQLSSIGHSAITRDNSVPVNIQAKLASTVQENAEVKDIFNISDMFSNAVEMGNIELTNNPGGLYIITNNKLQLKTVDYESNDLYFHTGDRDTGEHYATCEIVVNTASAPNETGASVATISVSTQVTNTDAEDTDSDSISDDKDQSKYVPRLQFKQNPDFSSLQYIPNSGAYNQLNTIRSEVTINTTNIQENNNQLVLLYVEDLLENPDYINTQSPAEGSSVQLIDGTTSDVDVEIISQYNKHAIRLRANRNYENYINTTPHGEIEKQFKIIGQQDNQEHNCTLNLIINITNQSITFKSGVDRLVIDTNNPKTATYTSSAIPENVGGDVVVISSLINNIGEIGNVTITDNPGNLFSLSNGTLSVDNTIDAESPAGNPTCTISIQDAGDSNSNLTLNVTVNVQDDYDEDDDYLIESDAPDTMTGKTDNTPLDAGLQLANSQTTSINKSVEENITQDNFVTYAEIKAMYDNPDFIDQIEINHDKYTISNDISAIDLTTSYDYESVGTTDTLSVNVIDPNGNEGPQITVNVTIQNQSLTPIDQLTGPNNGVYTYNMPADWSGFDSYDNDDIAAVSDTNSPYFDEEDPHYSANPTRVLHNPGSAILVVDLNELFVNPSEIHQHAIDINRDNGNQFTITNNKLYLNQDAHKVETDTTYDLIVVVQTKETAPAGSAAHNTVEIMFTIPMIHNPEEILDVNEAVDHVEVTINENTTGEIDSDGIWGTLTHKHLLNNYYIASDTSSWTQPWSTIEDDPIIELTSKSPVMGYSEGAYTGLHVTVVSAQDYETLPAEKEVVQTIEFTDRNNNIATRKLKITVQDVTLTPPSIDGIDPVNVGGTNTYTLESVDENNTDTQLIENIYDIYNDPVEVLRDATNRPTISNGDDFQLSAYDDGKLALMLKANRDYDILPELDKTVSTELTVTEATGGDNNNTNDVTVLIKVPIGNVVDIIPQWSTSQTGSFITTGAVGQEMILVDNSSAEFNSAYFDDIILSDYSSDGIRTDEQGPTIVQDSGLSNNRSDVTIECTSINIAQTHESGETEWVKLWDASDETPSDNTYISTISTSTDTNNTHKKWFNILSNGVNVPTDQQWYDITETDSNQWDATEISKWTGANGAENAMLVIKFKIYNTVDNTQSSVFMIKIYKQN